MTKTKKALASLGILTATFLTLQARADGWTPRLQCDGDAFVIDGLHSYERGFTAHQMVIRNPEVVAYFSQLVGVKLATNGRGELIRDLDMDSFKDEFTVTLVDVTEPGAPSGVLYRANGHSIDRGRYEVYVTSLSHYPGMTYHEPTYVGKWVFNGCTR